MAEQTTFTEADRTDGVAPDMVDQNHAPKSEAPEAAAVQPMNMIQALNSALHVKMAEDANVLSFGEDAGYFGGVFRVTDQLQQKHGLTRSFDAPISECGIVAAAIGMGAYGLRPVVEIQFGE
jgi:2-oxoisovalerate dehydrogenase E1 component beta subunit